MRPRLQKGKALLIPLSLLLIDCAARQEVRQTNASDIELRAALLDNYAQADVVAHINIATTENIDTLFADDGTPGYFLNSVQAEIIQSYKGAHRAGTEIIYTFQSDFDAASDSKWTPGSEWIVFLTYDKTHEPSLRCGEMPCQLKATEDVIQLMAEIRQPSP